MVDQSRLSKTQYILEQLEDDIVNRRLLPGERLDPQKLSERFGVSRTPIREAIQKLSVSGLVRVASKYGTFVSEISITELIEMFEVMAELEGMCGRLAARRISTSQLENLQGILRCCELAEEKNDPDGYFHENGRFHDCIYSASGNGFLISECRWLFGRLKPYRRLQLRTRNRIQHSLEEHRRIVEALAMGDAEQAARQMREHVFVRGEGLNDGVSDFFWARRFDMLTRSEK